jgi:uncharacterized membrane protein
VSDRAVRTHDTERRRRRRSGALLATLGLLAGAATVLGMFAAARSATEPEPYLQIARASSVIGASASVLAVVMSLRIRRSPSPRTTLTRVRLALFALAIFSVSVAYLVQRV